MGLLGENGIMGTCEQEVLSHSHPFSRPSETLPGGYGLHLGRASHLPQSFPKKMTATICSHHLLCCSEVRCDEVQMLGTDVVAKLALLILKSRPELQGAWQSERFPGY